MLNEFQSSMIRWSNEEKIKWKKTIVEGLENAPNAFIGLINGVTLDLLCYHCHYRFLMFTSSTPSILSIKVEPPESICSHHT